MAIPKFEDFLYPFMSHLMTGNSNKADMINVLSKHFNLSDEDRKLKTKGGTAYQINDRIGWSLQWLRRALFVEIPERGVWRITPRGRKYMESHNDLRESDLLQFSEFADYSSGNKENRPNIINNSIQSGNNSSYMRTNDNWLEIVETTKPIIDSKLPYISYCNAVETGFRLLGWKKSKGTLVTFFSSDPNTEDSLILLNIEKENIQIPIVPLDLSRQYSEESRVLSLFKAMKEMNSSVGLLFSSTIQIYYHDTAEETQPVCLMTISFNAQEEYGHALCDLLSYSTFSYKNLERFCIEEYEKIPTQSNLPKRLLAIAQDSNLIAAFLKEFLVTEGFEEEQVNNELNQYIYQIKLKDISEKDVIVHKERKGGSHDTTKFSLDGGKSYLGKRFFVLEVIRQYIKDHPLVTLDELEEVFPSAIISKTRGVVRPLSVVQEWVRENPDVAIRYFMEPDKIITLNDGMQIVVHNQWGSHFPQFLNIAKSLYNVTSNHPYPGIEESENDKSVVGEPKPDNTFGIKISADSISKFRSKK